MQHAESNRISIPLRGNNALAEIVSACATGNKVSLKDVEFIVDEATQELITGTITEIGEAKVIEDAPEETTEEEKEQARKAPVMSVMASDRDSDQGATSRDAFTA